MEPDLPVTTIVNEGVIYVALAVWCVLKSSGGTVNGLQEVEKTKATERFRRL